MNAVFIYILTSGVMAKTGNNIELHFASNICRRNNYHTYWSGYLINILHLLRVLLTQIQLSQIFVNYFHIIFNKIIILKMTLV